MEFTGNRGTTKKSPKIKKTTWFHSSFCVITSVSLWITDQQQHVEINHALYTATI